MGILDDHKLDITCPHCGHKINQTLRWIKQGTFDEREIKVR